MEKPRPRIASENPLKRHIADPGAMGLLAFAVITFTSGAVHCNWRTDIDLAIFSAAIWYGGMVQVIAGILDLLRGEKVSGSTFVAFGFYWVSTGYFLQNAGGSNFGYPDRAERNAVLGFYLVGWAFVALASLLAVLRTSVLQVILLSMVTFDFTMLAAIKLSGSVKLERFTGYMLVFTAALAYYLGVAFLLKGKSPIQLPIWEFTHENEDEDAGSYPAPVDKLTARAQSINMSVPQPPPAGVTQTVV